jgi:chromosome segregation ATPase
MSKSENKIAELEKEAQQASKKTSEFRNKAETAKNTAQTYLKTIEQLITTANSELSRIQEVKEESVSINSDLKNKSTLAQTSFGELIKSKESVEALVTQLETVFENHPELEEELTNLEEGISKSEEIITKINSLYKNSLTKKQEIDQLYIDINGYDEEDEETGKEYHIEGLKDKLENSYNTLIKDLSDSKEEIEELITTSVSNYNSLKKDWEAKYITLEKKIESLLPNALTAGLSSAYSTKKTAEETESGKLTTRFNWGIFGLILVSTIPFIISYKSFIDGVGFEELVLRLPRVVLSILPLYVPVLWFAYSANKKMNLSKRLIEEYTHKEVLSKTYEGLSKQINDIEDEDISSELKIKLLYNILEVSSENPGKLISDYNKSDHPLMDALEKSTKLSRAVDKLENIPGLGKLSKILDSKSKKILKDQADTIEDVLDNVE